jgi:hypothetical protein
VNSIEMSGGPTTPDETFRFFSTSSKMEEMLALSWVIYSSIST